MFPEASSTFTEFQFVLNSFDIAIFVIRSNLRPGGAKLSQVDAGRAIWAMIVRSSGHNHESVNFPSYREWPRGNSSLCRPNPDLLGYLAQHKASVRNVDLVRSIGLGESVQILVQRRG